MTKKKKLTVRERKWLNRWNGELLAKQNQRRRELINQTTLEQRKIFIEKLRESPFGAYGAVWSMWRIAMDAAGIVDDMVALEVYRKNSRPSDARILKEPNEVK